MNTLELFPLEVYTFDYDGDTDDLLERAIMSTRKLGGTFNDTRIDVSQSSPDALKLFPEIEKFIYDSLSEIKDRVKLQCEGLKITTSWVNRYRESAILPWHRHPMSAYSGAFFLNDRGGLTKFRFADGLQVTNTAEITRGFKAGYNIMQTAGKGVTAFRGGNGATGGQGGGSLEAPGGGGSGYQDGSVTVVDSRLGGSTGDAKVVLRLQT